MFSAYESSVQEPLVAEKRFLNRTVLGQVLHFASIPHPAIAATAINRLMRDTESPNFLAITAIVMPHSRLGPHHSESSAACNKAVCKVAVCSLPGHRLRMRRHQNRKPECDLAMKKPKDSGLRGKSNVKG